MQVIMKNLKNHLEWILWPINNLAHMTFIYLTAIYHDACVFYTVGFFGRETLLRSYLLYRWWYEIGEANPSYRAYSTRSTRLLWPLPVSGWEKIFLLAFPCLDVILIRITEEHNPDNGEQSRGNRILRKRELWTRDVWTQKHSEIGILSWTTFQRNQTWPNPKRILPSTFPLNF